MPELKHRMWTVAYTLEERRETYTRTGFCWRAIACRVLLALLRFGGLH